MCLGDLDMWWRGREDSVHVIDSVFIEYLLCANPWVYIIQAVCVMME